MNRKSYKARERDLEAVRLYKQGYTFRSISEALGCSIGTAHNAVKKAFNQSLRLSVEEAEIIRQVELERLDDMFIPAYQKATEGGKSKNSVCDAKNRRRHKTWGEFKLKDILILKSTI